MSELNKRLAREVVDQVWNAGKLELIERYYSEDFVCHYEPNEDWYGHDGVRKIVSQARSVWTEYEERVVDLIAEGDKVTLRLAMKGRNTGTLPTGDPATGKKMTSLGILIYRFSEGKIVEQWEVANIMGIRQQIGIL